MRTRSLKHFSLLLLGVFVFLLIYFVGISAAAKTAFHFDEQSSAIEGTIRYALLGQYYVSFEKFSGQTFFDANRLENCWVELNIPLASIKSKYPKLDRIVLSKRVLDAQNFPEIHFKSTGFFKENDGIMVEGYLSLHGVMQTIKFPIDIDEFIDIDNQRLLNIKGAWRINRKDFDIIFNKLLDHGGLVIGNHVLVDWNIYVKIN